MFSFNGDGVKLFPVRLALLSYGNNAVLNMGSIFIIDLFKNVILIVWIVMLFLSYTMGESYMITYACAFFLVK